MEEVYMEPSDFRVWTSPRSKCAARNEYHKIISSNKCPQEAAIREIRCLLLKHDSMKYSPQVDNASRIMANQACYEMLAIAMHLCESYEVSDTPLVNRLLNEIFEDMMNLKKWFEFLNPFGTVNTKLETESLYPFKPGWKNYNGLKEKTWITSRHLKALEYYLKVANEQLFMVRNDVTSCGDYPVAFRYGDVSPKYKSKNTTKNFPDILRLIKSCQKDFITSRIRERQKTENSQYEENPPNVGDFEIVGAPSTSSPHPGSRFLYYTINFGNGYTKHDTDGESRVRNHLYTAVTMVNFPFLHRVMGAMVPLTLACIQGDPDATLLLLRHGAYPIHPFSTVQCHMHDLTQPLYATINQLNLFTRDILQALWDHDDELVVEETKIGGVEIQLPSEVGESTTSEALGGYRPSLMLNRGGNLLKCLAYLSLVMKVWPPMMTYEDTSTHQCPAPIPRVSAHFAQYLPEFCTGMVPASLQHLCRCSIRDQLLQLRKLPGSIRALPLPKSLKDYVNLKV